MCRILAEYDKIFVLYDYSHVVISSLGSVDASSGGLSKVAKVLVILAVLLVTIGIFLFLIWKMKRRRHSHHSCPRHTPSETSAPAYTAVSAPPPSEIEMVPSDQQDPPPPYSSLSMTSPPYPHHPNKADMPQYPPPGKLYPWQEPNTTV